MPWNDYGARRDDTHPKQQDDLTAVLEDEEVEELVAGGTVN